MTSSRKMVEELPDALEDIAESYDSGYYYLRRMYDNTYNDFKRIFGDKIAKEYKKTSNPFFSLLNSPRVVKIFADCIENGDKEMLDILKRNYPPNNSFPYIPLHMLLERILPLELNDLSIVDKLEDLPRHALDINLTKEMVRALYKKFRDSRYMPDYILKVRDMDLYREYVKRLNFESGYENRSTALKNISHVHPDDIETFLDIIKDKITLKQVYREFDRTIPNEYVFPIIDFFNINLPAFGGDPYMVEKLFDQKRLQKGSYILLTELPSPSLIRKLKSNNSIVSLLDKSFYGNDDKEYEEVIKELGHNYKSYYIFDDLMEDALK